MAESAYYYIAPTGEEPMVFVVTNVVESIEYVTGRREHWFLTRCHERVSLASLLDDMDQAIADGVSLAGFRDDLATRFSRQNWRHGFVLRLFAESFERDYSGTRVAELDDPSKRQLFQQLLNEVLPCGDHDTGLNLLEAPQELLAAQLGAAADGTPPTAPSSTTPAGGVSPSAPPDPAGAEDGIPEAAWEALEAIRESDEAYEAFTDGTYQPQLIAALLARARDDVLSLVREECGDRIEEETERFLREDLEIDPEEDLFPGLPQGRDLAILDLIERRRDEVLEDLEIDGDGMTPQQIRAKIDAEDDLDVLLTLFEEDVEEHLWRRQRGAVLGHLRARFALQVEAHIHEFVSKELIHEVWETLFRRLPEETTLAMLHVIAANLDEVREAFDIG